MAVPDFMSHSMSPDYPSLIGTLVAGKYRIDHLLGEGGMGLVYAATHLDLARRVALKLIRRELMATESVAERFLREARAAARIQSEHVGRVLDVGRLETGEPYIVMEYLEGQDLALHLQRLGPFTWSLAVDLISEACEAIAEAHHHRIVHRDLKPENLFLVKQIDGALSVKVLDFGISKQLGDGHQVLTSPSTAIGSPQYMAPEQMEAKDVDVRADVWALGAILYEMVTGKRAFGGETLAQVCVQVLSGAVTPVRSLVPALPAPLALAIETCLRPDRAERFANVAAFSAAVAPFGTERAKRSSQRVHAVLGYPVASPSTGTAEWKGPAFEGTLIQGVSGVGGAAQPVTAVSANVSDPAPLTTLDVALRDSTTDGALPAASSHTVSVDRNHSLIPVFGGLAGVVAIGIGLWMFTRRYALEEEARIKAVSDFAAAYSAANGVQAPAASATAGLGEPTDRVKDNASESVSTPSGTNERAHVASSAELSSAASDTYVAPRSKPTVKPTVRSERAADKAPSPTQNPPVNYPGQSSLDVSGFGGRK